MQTINLFTGSIDELVYKVSNIPVNYEMLEFSGEKNFSNMLTKLREGCPVMAAKYAAQAQNKPFVATTSNEYQYSNEGLYFDIPTFLSGEPEYWLNEVENSGVKEAKDFFINISTAWWTSEEDIFSKLIKVVEIIDTLEATGQRLNIVLCTSHVSKEKTGKINPFTSFTTIKKADQPLNMQHLIFLIASPVVIRYCVLTMAKHIGLAYVPYSNLADEKIKLSDTSILYIPSGQYDISYNLIPYSRKAHRLYYDNADLTTIYNLK